MNHTGCGKFRRQNHWTPWHVLSSGDCWACTVQTGKSKECWISNIATKLRFLQFRMLYKGTVNSKWDCLGTCKWIRVLNNSVWFFMGHTFIKDDANLLCIVEVGECSVRSLDYYWISVVCRPGIQPFLSTGKETTTHYTTPTIYIQPFIAPPINIEFVP